MNVLSGTDYYGDTSSRIWYQKLAKHLLYITAVVEVRLDTVCTIVFLKSLSPEIWMKLHLIFMQETCASFWYQILKCVSPLSDQTS